VTWSPAVRLIALVLALAAGFGPGAVALAHGHAHEHLVEAHGAEAHHGLAARHHQPAAAQAADHAVGDAGPVIRAQDDEPDHAHPQLDASSVTARADFRFGLSVSAPPPAAVTFVLPPAQSVAVQLLTVAQPRAGPRAAPPPPSRAPPIG
jgi:hypothetical protein